MSSLTALLSDPDSFFRDRRSDPSLKGPVAVVAALALVSGLAAALQFRVLSQLFADLDAGTILLVAQVVTLAVSLVGPFVAWLLYAGVFHAISVVFSGEGSFSTTLALVGWGFVPSVFGSVVGAAVNVYRFNVRGVEVPAEITQASMQQFQRQLQSGPLVAVSAAVGILFTLWAAVLWTYAMKHARDLSLRDAALTVALPALVGVALSVRTLLTAL